MRCGYSKEILALYVENDLPHPEAAEKVRRHVSACAECEAYCENLERSQAFLKSRFRTCRQDAVTPEVLTGLRRTILEQIEKARLSWAVRLQRYALAGVGVLALVSASLIGQIQNPREVVFTRNDSLARPAGYREWVQVGDLLRDGKRLNVYMNPAAYREYSRSGKFPNGTMMVLESPSGLTASVKDSKRFATGWAYFSFTTETAQPLPQSAGCLSCHEANAASDHVFTQYYSILNRS